ncbi:MAG: entericidin A/B family lipoprotein [Thiotrichales bacterium]
MKKIAISTLIMAFLWLVSGCGTMAGVGQDIQSAGEKIEDAASKKK